MTTSNAVLAVLAFLNSVGPLGTALWVVVAMIVAWAAAFFMARAAQRLPGRKSFDVGGRFDQFYTGTLLPVKSGTINLIYTGYAALWLASQPPDANFGWLYDAWGNQYAGFAVTAGILFLAFHAARELLKSLWAGLRWLRLEARGMRWHTADSGEQYRILWLKKDGEFGLTARFVQNRTLSQKHNKIRGFQKRSFVERSARNGGFWRLCFQNPLSE